MPVTTSTAANGIREVYLPSFQKAVFRNNSLLPLCPPPIDSGGDTAFRWKINSSGNSSVELYSEGQGQPAAGNQSYVNAALSYLAFRFMTRVTGHARAALRSQWFNVLDEEQVLGMEDMVDLINTTFMGSTYGLENAIAATGTYAGIARGAVSYFESKVTAVNAQLASTDLQDVLEALKSPDYGVIPDLLISSTAQETNVYRLSPQAGMRTTDYSDPLPAFQNQRVKGMESAFIPDWTSTVMVFLRRADLALVQHQPYQVKEMAPSGDSDVYQNSWMGILAHKNPIKSGKLTGLTA